MRQLNGSRAFLIGMFTLCVGLSLFTIGAYQKKIQTSNQHPSGKVKAAPVISSRRVPRASTQESAKVYLRVVKVLRDVGGEVDALSPDGRSLVARQTIPDAGTSYKTWDFRSVNSPGHVVGDGGYSYAVAFSPDSKHLVSAWPQWHEDGPSGKGSIVKIWSRDSDRRPVQLTRFPGDVFDIAFSPDGRLLAIAGALRGEQQEKSHGCLLLWDTYQHRIWRLVQNLPSPISSLAFAPNGITLALGDNDGSTRLYDVPTAKLGKSLWVSESRESLIPPWRDAGILSLSFSPDGRTLATAGYGYNIHLWDTRTLRLLRSLVGHRENVESVAFLPSGHIMVSASSDKTVRFWDVRTGEVVRQLHLPTTGFVVHFHLVRRLLMIAYSTKFASDLMLCEVTEGQEDKDKRV